MRRTILFFHRLDLSEIRVSSPVVVAIVVTAIKQLFDTLTVNGGRSALTAFCRIGGSVCIAICRNGGSVARWKDPDAEDLADPSSEDSVDVSSALGCNGISYLNTGD